MKTYLFKIKYFIALSSLALLATAPAWAQNGPATDAAQPAQSQNSDSQVNRPVQEPAPQLKGESQWSQEQQQETAVGSVMDEPAGADNASNWSWLGLLGLLGLFGLKRRHEEHDAKYRSVRAT